MDALQNVRVRIDKNHSCRRVIIEPPNRVSFTFDRLVTCVQISTIEISGLRQSYECFGKMVVDDSIVHVHEHSAGGKIVVSVNGIADFFIAILKCGLEFIKLEVYMI